MSDGFCANLCENRIDECHARTDLMQGLPKYMEINKIPSNQSKNIFGI